MADLLRSHTLLHLNISLQSNMALVFPVVLLRYGMSCLMISALPCLFATQKESEGLSLCKSLCIYLCLLFCKSQSTYLCLLFIYVYCILIFSVVLTPFYISRMYFSVDAPWSLSFMEIKHYYLLSIHYYS